jgi:hypothetical protein
MQRDGFACIACHATDKTLNVHHAAYVRGRKPWDYPDSQLHTLCEDCHADEHGRGPAAIRAAVEVAKLAEAEQLRRDHPDIVDLLELEWALGELIPLLPFEKVGAALRRRCEIRQEVRRRGFAAWKVRV